MHFVLVWCYILLQHTIHSVTDTNVCVSRELPDKIIIGYANWGQCDDKIIEAVKNGVNIVIWFSIDLSMNITNNKPYIHSRMDINCIAMITYSIKELRLSHSVLHFISIGGWNSPHINTNIPVHEMYKEFHRWNTNQVANDKYNFHGFDGIDWDIEGHDDLNHPQNIMSVACIHFMAQFSQFAKKDNYLVTMAPAESYLDPTTSKFHRSLKHKYKEWNEIQPSFSYHGLNTYAPLLSDMYRTIFDLIIIQLYEGYSHAQYNISVLKQPANQYLNRFIELVTNKWWVEFSNDDGLGILSQFILVPKQKLIIGIANGWAGNGKLLLSLKKGYGIKYENSEIRLLLKRKLRKDLIIINSNCLQCDNYIDCKGDHGVICKEGTGIIYRHDLLVLGISGILWQANIKHSIELRHLFNNNSMKPADIFIPNWFQGKSVAFDIGITSATNSSIIEQSQHKLLAAANNFYSHKINKYKKYINDNNINSSDLLYQPLIFEDYGGMHRETINFIKQIGKLRAANLNLDESVSINYCFQKLSAILQKANAISLLNHYSVYGQYQHCQQQQNLNFDQYQNINNNNNHNT